MFDQIKLDKTDRTFYSMPKKNIIKGRPDYYLTPTRDFTRYVKDCEGKYWNKETSFDWSQDVKENLYENVESLNYEELYRISFLVLPMIQESIRNKIEDIKEGSFLFSEDALKDLSDCIGPRPLNESVDSILRLYAPLQEKRLLVRTLNDKLDILQNELMDLTELKRLGMIKIGVEAKYIESDSQRNELDSLLHTKSVEVDQTLRKYKYQKAEYKAELKELKNSVRAEQLKKEPFLLNALERTEAFIEGILKEKELPKDSKDLDVLRDLIVKRQLRGLKDIANHALVVEQSAIAPLTMGIVHYKRYREIQEALTTFINDEAKHSATFRRFLAEKLNAKEFISSQLIEGAKKYMWVARYAPGVGMFLAVIIEAIGASYLEFFSRDEIMPDKLFRNISKTISVNDETRHMDLCVEIYNELFRTGSKWERIRNNLALKRIMKSVYGDKHDDHHLIQAFKSFGVESDLLYNHVLTCLSQQLSRIGVYVTSEKLMKYIVRTN
ncbi:hypothetical protein [Tamlana flava]|uniref:hypothetical protein n=1 Tax=Tamlana flava TaxID=3158572 RepID=UPI00351BB2F9